MFVSQWKGAVRTVAALTLMFALAMPGWPQDSPPTQTSLPQAPSPVPATASSQSYAARDYSQARSQFPNMVAPYKPEAVPAPNLANTSRIDSLLRDGKVYL